MKRQKHDILIGFITFIALIILVYSIFYIIKVGKNKDYYRIMARVDDVANITPGTKIFLQGYEIGKVSEIKVHQNQEKVDFLVIMMIKNEIRIFENSKAEVTGLGLLGDMNIEIKFPEKKGLYMEPDSYIVLEQDVGIKELVADAQDTIKEIDKFLKEDLRETTNSAKVFVDKISTVLNDNSDSLTQSVELLNKDLKEFHKAVTTVNKLIGRNEKTVNEMLDNLHTSSDHMKKITTNVDELTATTTEEINKMAKNLAITSKNFAVVSEDIKKHPWKLLWKKDTDVKKAVEELEESIEKEKQKQLEQENKEDNNDNNQE